MSKSTFLKMLRKFWINLSKFWENFEKILRKFWENFEKILKKFWGNFEKILRKFWEILRNVEKFWGIFERILRVFDENSSRTNIRSVTEDRRQTDWVTFMAYCREACVYKKLSFCLFYTGCPIKNVSCFSPFFQKRSIKK